MNSNEALNAYSYTNQDHQSYNEHLSYKAIIDECERLRQEIQRISDETYGPIDKSSTANTKLPFALILGNHSSGKSTFINYLLENNIQASGVAPTDDCFTIIGALPYRLVFYDAITAYYRCNQLLTKHCLLCTVTQVMAT